MSDSVFSRNLIKKIRQTSVKSPVKFRGFLLICFPAIFILLFISGCAQQPRKISGKSSLEREPEIRVALYDNFKSGNLAFEGDFNLRLEEADYVLNENTGVFLVSYQNEKLVLRSPERYFSLAGPMKISLKPAQPGARFKVDNIPYSGLLKFILKSGRLQLINVLPMEEYLRGVVPAEIPTGEQNYREAVRAQAIAARTYALYHLENPASADFDVFADTRDQVYQGERRQPALSDASISETRGQVLTVDGRPAETLYHSTSGGILELDAADTGADSQTNPGYRLDKTDDEFNGAISPFFRWVEVRQIKMLLNRFSRWYKIPAKVVRNWDKGGVRLIIRVTERKLSGRVRKMEISAGGYRHTISGFTIRRFFADARGNPLRSTLFFMVRPTKKIGTLYLVGAGFGHGRGMSQWGALGMALRGKNYRDILKFYYPNFQLTKLY